MTLFDSLHTFRSPARLGDSVDVVLQVRSPVRTPGRSSSAGPALACHAVSGRPTWVMPKPVYVWWLVAERTLAQACHTPITSRRKNQVDAH